MRPPAAAIKHRRTALVEAALRAAVGRLPAGERLSAADLDRALDVLIGLNWLSRAEGPDPTYRVRFRPRRPRQYTAAADARAAGDLWATLV